jgi:hypothetical protein
MIQVSAQGRQPALSGRRLELGRKRGRVCVEQALDPFSVLIFLGGFLCAAMVFAIADLLDARSGDA